MMEDDRYQDDYDDRLSGEKMKLRLRLWGTVLDRKYKTENML